MRLLSCLVFAAGLFGLAPAAQALDCAKAKTPEELAICHDPALRAADDELNQAYRALRAGRDAGEQKVIEVLQADWLPSRTQCRDANNAVDGQCLLGLTRRRIAFLRGADGGPDSQGRLRFVGLYRPQRSVADTALKLSLFEFAQPDSEGKRLFNSQVQGWIDNARRDHAEIPPDADGPCHDCEFTVTMPQPFQAGSFISAPIMSWSYTGGNHGSGGTDYINLDLTKNAKLALTDLLLDYEANGLAKACYDQILARPDGDPGNAGAPGLDGKQVPSNPFMTAFRDPTDWFFDGRTLTVRFGLYVLGPYAAGEQTCALGYEAVKPYLVEGAVLPGEGR